MHYEFLPGVFLCIQEEARYHFACLLLQKLKSFTYSSSYLYDEEVKKTRETEKKSL